MAQLLSVSCIEGIKGSERLSTLLQVCLTPELLLWTSYEWHLVVDRIIGKNEFLYCCLTNYCQYELQKKLNGTINVLDRIWHVLVSRFPKFSDELPGQQMMLLQNRSYLSRVVFHYPSTGKSYFIARMGPATVPRKYSLLSQMGRSTKTPWNTVTSSPRQRKLGLSATPSG